MTIREATISDGPELARLRWEFSPEHVAAKRQSREAFVAEFSTCVVSAIREGRWRVWVAETGTRVIGNLYLVIIPKVPRPGDFETQFAYMTNVYVMQEYRNCGIGGLMIEAAKAWTLSVATEFVIVWPSTESVAFYGRHGFHPSLSMELTSQSEQPTDPPE